MSNTYIGTKIVIAEPMTRKAYNDYRGWTLPADENGDDEGYLVEYTDGGKANTLHREGYVSWSPKDVFERAYKPMPGAGLQPHQQRVVQEKAELDERMQKLHAFHASPTFDGLHPAEQERLLSQITAMSVYSDILRRRIAAFPPPDDFLANSKACDLSNDTGCEACQ